MQKQYSDLSSDSKKKSDFYYITTPIYYLNSAPHIGHAYTTIACDFIARFKTLDGYNVKFLTGTDEYGQKIEKAAAKAGKSPQLFVDQNLLYFKELLTKLSIQNTDFIRTTEERHKKFVQKIWQVLFKKGYIYLDKYRGWYSIRDEAFYTETELVEGKAPSGANVEWLEEESYFFRLSTFHEKLLKLYQKDIIQIKPQSRKNEVISFLKNETLKDLSISRTSTNWGIDVPHNEVYDSNQNNKQNTKKHVIYVWLDALFNYLSALEEEKHNDTNTHNNYDRKHNNDQQQTSNYWPCNLHVIGKDILRFHAIYWPAFLLALELPLPKTIFAHGWWVNEGEKISKSLGNVIDPLELIKEFNSDYLRYFLLREMPFGNDGSYSRNNLINRVNSELVNSIGNLIQRVLVLIYKHCDAQIPSPNYDNHDKNSTIIKESTNLLKDSYNLIPLMRQHVEAQQLQQAIGEIYTLSKKANIYIDRQKPWYLVKENPEEAKVALYSLAECIRVVAIALQPITPIAAEKMLTAIGYLDQSNTQNNQFIINNPVAFSLCNKQNRLLPNSNILKPNLIFPRCQ